MKQGRNGLNLNKAAGKDQFKQLLKRFKNDISSERPKPHLILNKHNFNNNERESFL